LLSHYQVVECKRTIYDLREEIAQLQASNGRLESNCKSLERTRDQLRKEAEWMMRQNNKLKGATNCNSFCLFGFDFYKIGSTVTTTGVARNFDWGDKIEKSL